MMEKDVRRTSYAAKILGPHDTYRLNRLFLSEDDYEDFPYDLPDGVYEFATTFRDKKTKKLLRRERTWFIMFDGMYREYADSMLTYDDILYTVFLIRVQNGGAA